MRVILTRVFILILILGLNSCVGRLFSSKPPVELEQAWASDNVFKTPESTLYDPQRNVIYVSNLNKRKGNRKDGDGFISKLGTDGQVEELYWVTGLNNPRGLALFNNVLYVADIDEIVAISTQSGAVLGRSKAEGAEYLNDIAVDEQGTVFVTDSEQKRIYQLRNGRVSTWLNNTAGEKPNGIYINGNRMMVAFMSNGEVRYLDPETKKFYDWTEDIPSADGIAAAGNGGYFVSSWDGEVFYVNEDGKNWSLLKTKDQNINSADISYAERLDLLLVPTFNDNRVVAYDVSLR